MYLNGYRKLKVKSKEVLQAVVLSTIDCVTSISIFWELSSLEQKGGHINFDSTSARYGFFIIGS